MVSVHQIVADERQFPGFCRTPSKTDIEIVVMTDTKF